MNDYMTFSEYVERRDAACHDSAAHMPLDVWHTDPTGGSPVRHDLPDSDVAGDEGQVEERSMFGALFKNPFKAVNPARPVTPTNSRLFAPPGRKRLKGQVVGR